MNDNNNKQIAILGTNEIMLPDFRQDLRKVLIELFRIQLKLMVCLINTVGKDNVDTLKTMNKIPANIFKEFLNELGKMTLPIEYGNEKSEKLNRILQQKTPVINTMNTAEMFQTLLIEVCKMILSSELFNGKPDKLNQTFPGNEDIVDGLLTVATTIRGNFLFGMMASRNFRRLIGKLAGYYHVDRKKIYLDILATKKWHKGNLKNVKKLDKK